VTRLPWVQTRYLWYRSIPESGATLYVVPYPGHTAEASVHRPGTFESFRLRYFSGKDAVEEAKQYLDRAESR